jgi:tripartite-type tricarboxylate transporter receptor subunit TctC
MSKTRMVHTPYKGDAPAITELLGGHIQVYFGGPLVLAQHISAGKCPAIQGGVTPPMQRQIASILPKDQFH